MDHVALSLLRVGSAGVDTGVLLHLWVPEHVGRARFGKWLEGARDWAISRQR